MAAEIVLPGYGRNRSKYYEYFNDFLTAQDYATGDWTLTTVEAGGGSATEAIGNLAGGVLVITNDIADDDSDFFQSIKEIFKHVAGKSWLFEMRAKVNEILQCDFVLGLQITDTTPLAVTDGVYFRKDDGDALLDAVVVKDSSASTLTGVKTLVADTYYQFQIYYDGGSYIQFRVDGEGVGKLALTNMVDDEELAISFGIQQGEATNAKIMSVDYIRLVVER